MKRVLLVVMVLGGCVSGTSPAGSSSSSSSSSGGSTSGEMDAGNGQDSGSSTNPRQCGADTCAINEVCLRTPDAGICRARCSLDGGCGTGEVCRPALGDAGSNICIPGGGVGDECSPDPCLDGLVCAHLEDAGARCRYACGDTDDAGMTLECPPNWVCFPFPDASAGACFPR